jgi:hypothetical protein
MGSQKHALPSIQTPSQQAPSRGSFAWLLPLYTVGVVIFLVYTFFKVLLSLDQIHL